jgi:hypothetical protein
MVESRQSNELARGVIPIRPARSRPCAALVLVAACAAAIGCATAIPAPTSGPLDWEVVEESWSIQLVTRDEAGEARVTSAWIAAMDGHAVMRTGDTHWLQDIQRDPAVCLIVEDETHPMLGQIVEDEAEADEIAAVMVEKYGWQKRWLMAVRPRSGSDSFIRLFPRTKDDPTGCPGDAREAP